MKKRVFGRKLGKNTKQRKSLFRNLMRSLILEERIKTTAAKAKSVKGQVEKLVTKAKIGEASRKLLEQYFTPAVTTKMIVDIAPRFEGRPGGYTRIINVGTRLKDNAPMVFLEWVEGSRMSAQPAVKLPEKTQEDKKQNVSAKEKKVNEELAVKSKPTSEKKVKKVTKKATKKKDEEK